MHFSSLPPLTLSVLICSFPSFLIFPLGKRANKALRFLEEIFAHLFPFRPRSLGKVFFNSLAFSVVWPRRKKKKDKEGKASFIWQFADAGEEEEEEEPADFLDSSISDSLRGFFSLAKREHKREREREKVLTREQSGRGKKLISRRKEED